MGADETGRAGEEDVLPRVSSRGLLPVAPLEAALAVDAAHGLRHRLEPLRRDLAAAPRAGAVAAVGERAARLGDPRAPPPRGRSRWSRRAPRREVSLPWSAGVLVEVGELGVALPVGLAQHGGAGSLEPRGTLVESLLDVCALLRAHASTSVSEYDGIGCRAHAAVSRSHRHHLLPPARASLERHGIHVVPLYIVFGGDRTVAETEITDYPAFFEELRSAESCPPPRSRRSATSCPPTSRCSAEGGEVVSVHISGGLSGTVESARQRGRDARARRQGRRAGARDRLDDRRGRPRAAGARGGRAAPRQGLAGRGDQRGSAEARGELKMWFAIDTLEFLRRGGRIGAASAWIGSTLKVKPILTVENEMAPVERVRTSSRAFERMVDYAAPAPRVGRGRLGACSTSTRRSRTGG